MHTRARTRSVPAGRTRSTRAHVAGSVVTAIALSTAGGSVLARPVAATPQYVCQHPAQSVWMDSAGTLYIDVYCVDEWWPVDPMDPPVGGIGGTGGGGGGTAGGSGAGMPNACAPYTPRGYQEALAAADAAIVDAQAALASANLSLSDATTSLDTDTAAFGQAQVTEAAALDALNALTAGLDPTGGSRTMRPSPQLQAKILRARDVHQAAAAEVNRITNDVAIDTDEVQMHRGLVLTREVELADATAHLDRLQTCH